MQNSSAFFVCLILLLGIACAINPVTGKRELSLYSEQDEIALGRETDIQIKRQFGIYEDSSLNSYVAGVGQSLSPHTHRPQLNYSFAVLDSPVVNAFAVPGGYIYVTRGRVLLKGMPFIIPKYASASPFPKAGKFKTPLSKL